jgi:hypothetical protein
MANTIPYKKIGVSGNGWASEDLAIYSYRLRAWLKGEKADWESESQDVQERWDRAMTKAIQLIDECIEREESLSMQRLSVHLCEWYEGSLSEEEWMKLTLKDRFIWEAIGRNLVNCLESMPGSVKIEEANMRWSDWISRKV